MYVFTFSTTCETKSDLLEQEDGDSCSNASPEHSKAKLKSDRGEWCLGKRSASGRVGASSLYVTAWTRRGRDA
ncbi:MAG: hypothetical protein IJS94_04185 [Clostridia bacterium]|nr:hypothetical protein [Clostridia bacterium]